MALLNVPRVGHAGHPKFPTYASNLSIFKHVAIQDVIAKKKHFCIFESVISTKQQEKTFDL